MIASLRTLFAAGTLLAAAPGLERPSPALPGADPRISSAPAGWVQDLSSARLVVDHGWVRLVEDGRERLLLPADGPRELSGAWRLEVSAGGRARLNLGGQGRLEFEGSTQIRPREGGLTLGRLGSVEIESRAAGLALELPQGQVLRSGQTAFRLDGRPEGEVDFSHRGGSPVRLEIGGRYPFELPTGRRVRLPRPLN